VVDVKSPHVAETDDSVVGTLEAEATSVVLPVAEGSTAEVAEEVTSITEPLEMEWYGAGGGGGGPWGGGGEWAPGGGGGAAFPGGGGSAEAEARPKLSIRAASVETIFWTIDVFLETTDGLAMRTIMKPVEESDIHLLL
jgi:hypothetical protein